MVNAERHVEKIQQKIRENEGKFPYEWNELRGFLSFVLRVLKFFTNEKVDAIIDEILAAIDASFKK